MRLLCITVATVAILGACHSASAQSTTEILQRLSALEQSNAELKKENAVLRDRVKRIESAKQNPSAGAAPAGSASYATKPTAAYASASPVYKAAPMGAPLWSWTGFYVGGHGGYAQGKATGPDLTFDQHSGFGGVQMGVNYQFWDHWVIGFEQDVSFTDLKGSADIVGGTIGTVTFKVDAFGSFRERVGYAWGGILLYQTAGVAWAQANPTIVVTAPNPESLEDKRLMTGFAAGGGIEVAATPNLTVKAEYLFLDFPDKNFFAGTDQRGAADQRIHTVRVGLNWLAH